MRIACWIPKVTDIHSDYVIITFLRQQWALERASMLRLQLNCLSCNSPTVVNGLWITWRHWFTDETCLALSMINVREEGTAAYMKVFEGAEWLTVRFSHTCVLATLLSGSTIDSHLGWRGVVLNRNFLTFSCLPQVRTG
jgi:hypothetical protein